MKLYSDGDTNKQRLLQTAGPSNQAALRSACKRSQAQKPNDKNRKTVLLGLKLFSILKSISCIEFRALSRNFQQEISSSVLENWLGAGALIKKSARGIDLRHLS